MNCFGELQNVNRKINAKQWEKEKFNTKCVMYKVSVYTYLGIHVHFQLRYKSGYVCPKH